MFPFKTLALSASSYVVMDYNSGRILEGSNVDSKRLIASTTKIMTCIIALEHGDLDREVTIDEDVLKAYGSAIYIEVGEKIKLQDLLYGLMLRSGNDAAIEIANNIAGSVDNFVALMNNKAMDLGMSNSIFVNPSGLEERDGANYSSSKDMGILMRYALGNANFVKIINTKEYKVKSSNKTYLWQNKNRLLKEYKYTIGGKTGFTEKARRTLVTAAKKDNKELIVVTLNDPNDFQDHKDLYESDFLKYHLMTILNKNNCHIPNGDRCFLDQDYKMLVTKDEEKRVNINYEINEDDVKFGKANIYLNDNKIESITLYKEPQKDNKDNRNWWQKLWDILIFWK